MRILKGFTLIELTVVLAIFGVLAAIAMPAYQQYVIRTNRADVQAELIQIAQRIETYKLARGGYKGVLLSNSSIYGASQFPKTGTAFYNIALTTTPAAPTADDLVTGWQLSATPIASTVQKDNGVILLNDLGHKCWEKAATTCTLSVNSNWSEK